MLFTSTKVHSVVFEMLFHVTCCSGKKKSDFKNQTMDYVYTLYVQSMVFGLKLKILISVKNDSIGKNFKRGANGAILSFIAPSSGELWVPILASHSTVRTW